MTSLQRITIDHDELHSTFGFGVAGNFAGHLEQAGEAADFVNVSTAAQMPKGIFPWYSPGSNTFLGAPPLSHGTLTVPDLAHSPGRIQVEPEAGLMCDVMRDDEGVLRGLTPRWIAAFDDCSLRRPNARKISEKKNWGAASKGLSRTAFKIDNLSAEGPAASLRLACFLRRDGATHEYGVDSAIASYTLFGDALLAWLVDRLQSQRGSADTPLEDVGALLDESGSTSVLVGVGASRYTPLGESTFVQAADEAIVVLYDSRAHAREHVATCIAARDDELLQHASVLRRIAR